MLDSSTKKIVHVVTCCLPDSTKEFFRESYLTQTQLLTYSLGIALLLQATVGNPFLSLYIACPAAVLGVVSVAPPTYRHIKSHGKEVIGLPLFERILCIVYPILFMLGMTFGECVLGLYFNFSLEGTISMVLWSNYLFEVMTIILLHTNLIDLCRKNEALYSDIALSQFKIRDLEEKTKKVNDFVSAHPEFKAICEKCFIGDSLAFIQRDPINNLENNLDSKVPSLRATALLIKKVRLKQELRDWGSFIERHAEVKACFQKCLEKEEVSEKQDLLKLSLLQL